MRFLAFLLVLQISGCATSATQVPSLKLLAQTELDSQTKLKNIPFGGLSGMIALGDDEYLAISDDRSQHAPARFIKMKISYDEGKLNVVPMENIFLTDKNGKTFAQDEVDGESIAKDGEHFWVGSEGSYHKGLRIEPFIRSFDLTGKSLNEFELNRTRYIPEATGIMTRGIRVNSAFESLSISPNSKRIFLATETALQQDAPENYHPHNIIRLAEYDLKSQSLLKEYPILLDHIQVDAAGGYLTAENGLSDILALSEHELLLLERAWLSAIKKQFIRIYYVNLKSQDLDVKNISSLKEIKQTLSKTLVLDFSSLGLKLDNMEILCFGPTVNGKATLIVASDNNFSRHQTNLFYLFELSTLPK